MSKVADRLIDAAYAALAAHRGDLTEDAEEAFVVGYMAAMLEGGNADRLFEQAYGEGERSC